MGIQLLKQNASVSVRDCAAHTSLKKWLESLRLTEYLDAFAKNNFTDVEKLRKIWEVELTTVQIVVKNFLLYCELPTAVDSLQVETCLYI